jgi:hypothetical protein
VGCTFAGLATVITLVRSREALWTWVAISIAIVLFLVPVALAFVVPRGVGGIVYRMWAVVFAQLTAAWAVAFVGLWVYRHLAQQEASGE